MVEGLYLGSEAISPLLLPDHRSSAVFSYLTPMQETLDMFLDQKGNGQLMGRVRDLILSGQTAGQMLSITAVWFGRPALPSF